ncbi:MAG: hypothetical protein CME61_07605 [Halobacteriovoraceae bacterium]|nr:hypothetical protein [Halobacteriovoraceae bacterium]
MSGACVGAWAPHPIKTQIWTDDLGKDGTRGPCVRLWAPLPEVRCPCVAPKMGGHGPRSGNSWAGWESMVRAGMTPVNESLHHGKRRKIRAFLAVFGEPRGNKVLTPERAAKITGKSREVFRPLRHP